MICRFCKREFDRKNIKGGYIDQCDRCTLRKGDVQRYIGVHGVINKSNNIEVVRTNIGNMRRYIKSNMGGVNNPIAIQVWNDRKEQSMEEFNKLEKELD